MDHHEIPKASAKAIKNTVSGFHQASSPGEAIDHDVAAEESENSADVIRRQKAFLTEIGVLNKESRGEHSLTENGRQFGRALTHDRDDDAREICRSILLEWEATDAFLEDLEDGYHTRDEVRGSIAYVTGNTLSNHRSEAGANGLIDLYEWVKILETNTNGKYAVAVEKTEETESGSETKPDDQIEQDEQSDTHDEVPKEKPTEGPLGQSNVVESIGLPENSIDISLELTGDEDPENVRRLILAVRQGLERDLERAERGVSSEGGLTDKSLDAFGDD